MKFFSRIMVILMALVLALGVSVASAAPSNLSEIEGLPECPEAPAMKVKRVGQDYTLTLSAPLTWLNVIQNWQWMDIIKWNEDKTVGTYNAAGLKSAPGTGTWNSHSSWSDLLYWGFEEKEDAAEYVKTEDPNYVLPYDYVNYWDESWMYDEDKDFALKKEFAQDDAWWSGAHYFVGEKKADEVWFYNEGEEEWEFDSYGVWKPVTMNMYGAYCQNGGLYQDIDQFAYDGGLEDGSDVKYSQGGKVVSITVTKTGVNYLGGEKEPVKTEVSFRRQYNQMYLYSIKETYDDDTTLQAIFSFNGARISLK